MPTLLPVRDRIFISYRRDDARGASGRLYDWLRIAFGREHVFRDVASIGVGRWRDKIDAALAQSAVCVAVIGPCCQLGISICPLLLRRADSFFAQLSLTRNRWASCFRLIPPLSYTSKNLRRRSFEYGSAIGWSGQSPLSDCTLTASVHSNY